MSGKAATIRNLAFIGHSGCGKTSLAEALLFSTGATNRLGKVDDGTSVLDYEPEELKRKITISSAFHHYSYKKHTVYLADTPGDDNFLADTRAVLHVVDGAVVVIDAVDGVKVGTEKVWHTADQYNLPRLVFINKMDRERADYAQVLAGLKNILEAQIVPLQLPIGQEASFQGVVDLVSQKAYTGGSGKKMESGPIPDDLKDEVEQWRGDLLNYAAESDDALIEKFLEEGDLSPEEIYQGLRLGALKGQFVPVLFGATHNNLGFELLLDAINQEHGTAIVLVTHNLGVVAEFCQAIIVMYAGQLMEKGHIDPVVDDPKHPYTRGLLRCLPRIGARREKILPIPGLVPDLADLPPGCPFSPRCDRVMPQCSQVETVPLTELPDGRLVRCLLY